MIVQNHVGHDCQFDNFLEREKSCGRWGGISRDCDGRRGRET